MNKHKQSIQAAMRNPKIRRAINGLVGCPIGRWPETAQAARHLRDELPSRGMRHYTVDDLIHAALCGDHARRYMWREEVQP